MESKCVEHTVKDADAEPVTLVCFVSAILILVCNILLMTSAVWILFNILLVML